MRMIIGGAFQGKTAYAAELFPAVSLIDGRECSFSEIENCQGINHFEEYIKRVLEQEGEVSHLAGNIIEKNPDILIISREVGYGVVPVNRFDRAYREAVGRVCTELAAFSDEVHRVVCGIGTVIKGG